MKRWTFYSYVSARGTSLAEDWLEGQTPAVQARFEAAFRHLEQQPREVWKRPHFDTLKGECSGLGEIRFKADSVQHRPIGFFGPNRGEFTFLLFAIEKDNSFIPKRACKTARQRKSKVLDDKERIRLFDPF